MSNAFVSSLPLLRTSSSRRPSVSHHPKRRYYTPVPAPARTRARIRVLACASLLDTRTKLVDLFPNSGDVKVLATDGRGEVDLIPLASNINTSGGVVAIGWLRHYGCTLCAKQAKGWQALNMGDNGLKILIGSGTPEQAAQFAAEVNWKPEDLYSDPQRTTYQALGFAKGPGSTFTLDALKVTINSLTNGNNQVLSRIPTDPFQQGGAVIVDRNEVVRFIHRDAFAGDHAPVRVLQNVVDRLVKEGSSPALATPSE